MVIQDELYALRNAQRLLGPDWNRRIQAANRLGEARAEEAVADLEAVALECQHPELVKSAIRALNRIQAETAVQALSRVLENSPDEATAAMCQEGLLRAGKHGSPTTRQAIFRSGDSTG